MPAWLVLTELRSATPWTAPSRAQLAEAWRAAAPSAAPGLDAESLRWFGRWLGPSPRVTRLSRPLSPADLLGSYATFVAWVYTTPASGDPEWDAELGRQVLDALRTRLGGQLAARGWRAANPPGDPLLVGPYAPAAHGSVEWWTSGRAASEATYADAFAGLGQVPDNPIGPNTDQAARIVQAIRDGAAAGVWGAAAQIPGAGSVARGVAAEIAPWAAGAALVYFLATRKGRR